MNKTNNNNIERDCICDRTCGVTSQLNGGKPAAFKNGINIFLTLKKKCNRLNRLRNHKPPDVADEDGSQGETSRHIDELIY